MALVASVSSEAPCVRASVEKLQELGGRMQLNCLDFKENDINNLNKIIEAINELEEERKEKHENLETETIKSSILRYELKLLPDEIQDEIMNAVNAARQSNAEALQNLQEKLGKMNTNILDLSAKASDMESENSILQPEKELLYQQHEEIIAQLNEKMADKAMMQIGLNETRDKVRQANQNIDELEDSILQLKEDLIQERTDARQEKKLLKKAVNDTQAKAKEQREQNIEKKREVDTHQEKLMESEGRLDALRKSIRRFETSRGKLESDETSLILQVERQLKLNEQQRRRGAEIINESLREEQEFESKQRILTKRLKTLKQDIAHQLAKTGVYEERRVNLFKDLKEKEKIKEEEALYVGQLDSQLQITKRNLSEKAEDVGRMQAENIEISQELIELEESHKAVLAQLNNQIEEQKDLLSRERNERMELQQNKDEVGKKLQEIKIEQQVFMKSVTEAIQEGKKQHVQLSNEGVQLQREVIEDEELIKQTEEKLKSCLQCYEEMFNTFQYRVNTIETKICEMQSKMLEQKSKLSEETPIFQHMQEFFEKRNADYDLKKKSLVGLKNKRFGLEDDLKRARKDRDELKLPQVTLQNNLKDFRNQVIEQINIQGKSLQDMEQLIFLAGCQMKMIMEENQRLEMACQKLESDMTDLGQQILDNKRIKKIAEEDLVFHKNDLKEKFQTEHSMQE
ncbi:unnamed protein product, partial [Lymnaea stagnalis]